MITYDYILQGHEGGRNECLATANALLSGDLDILTSDQDTTLLYCDLLDSIESINIWYNIAADYYFFEDSSNA